VAGHTTTINTATWALWPEMAGNLFARPPRRFLRLFGVLVSHFPVLQVCAPLVAAAASPAPGRAAPAAVVGPAYCRHRGPTGHTCTRVAMVAHRLLQIIAAAAALGRPAASGRSTSTSGKLLFIDYDALADLNSTLELRTHRPQRAFLQNGGRVITQEHPWENYAIFAYGGAMLAADGQKRIYCERHEITDVSTYRWRPRLSVALLSVLAV
jgi:hypothetical protein